MLVKMNVTTKKDGHLWKARMEPDEKFRDSYVGISLTRRGAIRKATREYKKAILRQQTATTGEMVFDGKKVREATQEELAALVLKENKKPELRADWDHGAGALAHIFSSYSNILEQSMLEELRPSAVLHPYQLKALYDDCTANEEDDK